MINPEEKLTKEMDTILTLNKADDEKNKSIATNTKKKQYTIKLCEFYAFGSETTILEANNEEEAIDLARELYPSAEGYVIIKIKDL